MILRPCLALSALWLIAAGVALAEPPAKHAVTVRERWRAGDVFTRTGHETETTRIKVVAEGKPVSDQTLDRQVTYNSVGRVVEVDDAGHATKTILYFLAWSQAAAGAQDESLSGVFVELTGRGAARRSRILTPDARVTEAAERWLNERFGKPKRAVDLAGRDPDDLYEPARPLAVGETWAPDVGPIAKLLAASQPVVVDKVAVEGTLEAVSDGAARVIVALTIPLRGLQTREGSPLLAWKEGGTLERTLRATRPTTGGFEGTQVGESKVAGMANALGADVDYDQSVRTEVVVKAGGTMPPLPEPPATSGAR